MDCLEPKVVDFYNQEPSVMKCIEGMNKELTDSEEKLKKSQEMVELLEAKEKLYENVIKNLLYKIISKDGEERAGEPECLEEGIELFEYNRRKGRGVPAVEYSFIQDACTQMNKDDFNEDNNTATLFLGNTQNNPLLFLEFPSSDEESDDNVDWDTGSP